MEGNIEGKNGVSNNGEEHCLGISWREGTSGGTDGRRGTKYMSKENSLSGGGSGMS